ncbi:alpha/beta hydrolase [Saccharopolyspora sp. TS4A08]|uniref:Alpha/beta hydrolase n=1 Tax=Saccharopolyspora ipomoeae TaxID=3042027 RepID=A0ABT6PUJ0_9PSEU|nr:alpha/beta hydrolase [Saccharopolyspora sp. TS4A08]MDI2031683.1 alpha/beta hydrolase [Saccharopolyspora sp. TS4A08]
MLNTWVAGNPGAMRGYAQQVHKLSSGVEKVATGAFDARNQAASEWDGAASEAFQGWTSQQGGDGDALAGMFGRVASAVEAWCDEIDTVKSRMEQAKQVANGGGLIVLRDLIYPPKPLPAADPNAIPGSGTQPPQAQSEAAQAKHAQAEAAYAEAEATVTQARDMERSAHAQLIRALDAAKNDVGLISQAGVWEQAGANPSSPAGTALAGAATAMETRAAEATKGIFEQATAHGPAATRACWDSLSTAQRADLMDRFPQMIGNGNGLPTTVRHEANLALLASQRQALESKYRAVQQRIADIRPGDGLAAEKERLETQKEQLEESLAGLKQLDTTVHQPGHYLLGIDATASGGRGQAIIANGNPDTAQNVMTTVPGTYSDLGDVMNYSTDADKVMQRAQALEPNQSFASITYAGYESPPSLPDAANGRFAEEGSRGLSEFQEGLRVGHELDQPSNNTVIGHSYGTTEVGYAARDHGIHADNIVFLGSPGVGVDHASELGVDPNRVWSGTANLDVIDYATPSPNPADYGRLETTDDHWFGRNPSDPSFGGQELPVHDWSYHGDYWTYDESVDGMARVVANHGKGN